jgi:hypothetical protein
MGKFQEALQAVDQSLDIYEQTGPDNRLVETLLVKDLILPKARFPDAKVLETLERTHQKAQELGRPLAIAQALELSGDVYTKQRDVSSARVFYEAAQTQYETIGKTHMGVRGVSRCQANCRQLSLMEGNPEFKWKGLLIDEL